MVLKRSLPRQSFPVFENDVKTYGTETHFSATFPSFKFENDVKTYGTETQIVTLKIYQAFENDVKMYGTETAGTFFRSSAV